MGRGRAERCNTLGHEEMQLCNPSTDDTCVSSFSRCQDDDTSEYAHTQERSKRGAAVRGRRDVDEEGGTDYWKRASVETHSLVTTYVIQLPVTV